MRNYVRLNAEHPNGTKCCMCNVAADFRIYLHSKIHLKTYSLLIRFGEGSLILTNCHGIGQNKYK